MSDPTPHSSQDPADGPAVGQDEWVARHGERRLLRGGRLGTVEARLRRVPWWAWLVLFVGLMCLLPAVSASGYVRDVAFETVLYMLLALGLNVGVGWGGLLDLGFVAFYGFGAYTYAWLSSDKFGVHLPTLVTVPAVVIIGALLGLLLGVPSRRLTGDYLAIVTLFFLQLFQTLMTNGDNVQTQPHRRPERILKVDPFHAFGHKLVVQHGACSPSRTTTSRSPSCGRLRRALVRNNSRTGRAWRSQREDALAAEAMGMPVSWLKLMSFAFGAAVAALTGTLFASQHASVFPLTFYFTTLIIVYTMVILGGAGSQPGVVLGALIVSPLLEMLRDPNSWKATPSSTSRLSEGDLRLPVLAPARHVVVAGTIAFSSRCTRLRVQSIPPRCQASTPRARAGSAHWVVVPVTSRAGWRPSRMSA
jgi:branched-chain amino acid transport system permease protein